MKLRTIGFALCVGALAGCAKESKTPSAHMPTHATTTPTTLPAGTVAEDTVTGTATVVKIDQKTRHVTLKGEDGKTETIVVGPEVRNLAQVKKGDVLKVSYHQSIAYQVSKASTSKPGASTSTDVTRAAPGEKPGGTVTGKVTLRATIDSIDKKAGTVTLRDSKGQTKTIKAKDPSKLDLVSVGDIVDITYTEALAISVEPAGKSTASKSKKK